MEREIHADFMAGCALAQDHKNEHDKLNWKAVEVESAVMTMFRFGDADFNEKDHHGEPQLRAAMSVTVM